MLGTVMKRIDLCVKVYRVVPFIVSFSLLFILSGCPVNINRVPGDTLFLKDAKNGYRYYLYLPSYHNLEDRWPIVVACHGSNPFDTAWHQIHEWRGLAEEYSFIVIAPELKSTNSFSPITVLPEVQLSLQRQDEEAILSIVHDVMSKYNGDANHIYLTGWSGGGYIVYYAGLRHPELFRALAIKMGNFDRRFFPDADLKDRLDPYQPVLIITAGDDFPSLSKQAREAYRWLKGIGMKRLRFQEVKGLHNRKPENTRLVLDYFRKISKEYTFVKYKAIVGIDNDPLRVGFTLSADPVPSRVLWDLGDGSIKEGREIIHRYKDFGEYTIRVFVITADSARTERTFKITLPRF